MILVYQALAGDGTTQEGRIEASSRADALRRLAERGLRPLYMNESLDTIAAEKAKATHIRGRVSAAEVETFIRQLAALLAAGIPLARALERLAAEAGSGSARAQWEAIHGLVVEGASLAEAMGQFPRTFPRIYIAMVKAGEAGGFLDVVLNQVAEFQSRERDLRGKVTAALAYPLSLAVLATAVVAFLLVYFIPKFKTIFADFGAQLPYLTRVIVGLGEGVRHYGPAMLALAAVGVVLFLRWWATPAGRLRWEQGTLRLPLVGILVSRFAMVRFCRMLGTLVGAGVPLLAALRVARESLGNQVLTRAVDQSVDRLSQGGRLADSLRTCSNLFPGSALEIISVAEETGRLDVELIRLADTTENELDRRLRMAVSLAEPAMLVMMAAVVGMIVVGMVLPIFALQDYIR
jgi:type II secretory pathway component PulF